MSRLNGGNALRIATAGLPIMRILVILTIFVNVSYQQKEKEDYVCPEGTTGNGNFADPATCRRFYQCVDGFPYLNRCPSGLYFDDISKFCTFKVEARCGPIATTPAPITETPLDLATKCEPADCQLPACFCSKDGTIIPGGLDPEDTPQMIMLTFDGAVNLNNFELYKKVFYGIKNPNGCPVHGTYFLSHEYSNYAMVQALAHEGHEIATGTISQQQGLQDKGYEEWAGEMIGMREILKRFANVSRGDVLGTRAPYLKPGRNTQFQVLEDFGYVYDSSIGVPPLSIPVWPYTLDYKIPHECKSGTCPTKQFPVTVLASDGVNDLYGELYSASNGHLWNVFFTIQIVYAAANEYGLWEIPFNAHYVASFEGGHCPYLDQCVLHNHDSDDVLEWLQEDFKRHYEQNRAPYMMPFHTNWFQIKALERGLHKFLHWANELPDVWILTMTQALTWITEPQTNKQMNNKYEGWRCDKELPAAPCNLPNKCALSFKHPDANFTDTRYMESCSECPKKYPWLGDSGGTGIPDNDNYLPDNFEKK